MHLNWSPGIGDPTVGGWVTVALYFSASVSCWITVQRISPAHPKFSSDRRVWLSIAVLFLLLGINKQLDLQSALTEIGRMLAFSEGWYPERRLVQAVFIGIVALACLLGVIILLNWARHAPGPTWVGILGTVSVFCFVLIRAASFHHIDRFLGSSILGFRWNWVLEMGGISLTLIASVWRRKAQGSSTER
jgi:hypothetical protein